MNNKNILLKQNPVFFIPNRRPRVLLIKLDHRGDFVLNFPVFHKVLEKFKGAHLTILCGSWNVDLANHLGIFDIIHTYDFFKSSSSIKPSRDIPREVELLNKMGHFDIAIDLRRPGDARFFLALVNATVKVSYRSFNVFDEEMTFVLDSEKDENFQITNINKIPTTLQSLRLIDSIPIETFPTSNLHTVKKISSSNKSKKIIAFFPFSGVALREWPFDRYLTLAEKLYSESKDIRFYTHNLEEEIYERISNLSFIQHFNSLPIDQLIHSVDEVDLIVANNSFGVHLGSLRNVKTLGIYGGQERVSEWGPIGINSVAIYSEIECSPCHFGKIEECISNLKCINDIEVDDVYNAIENLLVREINESQSESFYWYNSIQNAISFNVERIFDPKNELKIVYELDSVKYLNYLKSIDKSKMDEQLGEKKYTDYLFKKILNLLRKKLIVKRIIKFILFSFPSIDRKIKQFLGVKQNFIETEDLKNTFIQKKIDNHE